MSHHCPDEIDLPTFDRSGKASETHCQHAKPRERYGWSEAKHEFGRRCKRGKLRGVEEVAVIVLGESTSDEVLIWGIRGLDRGITYFDRSKFFVINENLRVLSQIKRMERLLRR